MLTPSRASKTASGSRGRLARKSSGLKYCPAPHLTCWRPTVTKAVARCRSSSQAGPSRRPDCYGLGAGGGNAGHEDGCCQQRVVGEAAEHEGAQPVGRPGIQVHIHQRRDREAGLADVLALGDDGDGADVELPSDFQRVLLHQARGEGILGRRAGENLLLAGGAVAVGRRAGRGDEGLARRGRRCRHRRPGVRGRAEERLLVGTALGRAVQASSPSSRAAARAVIGSSPRARPW